MCRTSPRVRRKPFIALRQPVVEPLYETKPGWWIAHEMARRLGLEADFPWASPEEHLHKLLEPLHANLGELQATGALAFEGRPYIEDRLPEDGALFPTESGKILTLSFSGPRGSILYPVMCLSRIRRWVISD